MKHKYAEMIKEKVDNMDLVLLIKVNGEWKESSFVFPGGESADYFLCHPKHVDQTIHWLNSGEVIFEYYGDEFIEIREDGDQWSPHLWCMSDECESRIKPKKEKRWIVVDTKSGCKSNFCSNAYLSKIYAMERAKSLISSKTQIIEIEIEVD